MILFCLREWAVDVHGKFHGPVLAKSVLKFFLRVNGFYTWKFLCTRLICSIMIDIVSCARER